MSRAPKAFVASLLVAVVQLGAAYPRLPARVASHFNGAGLADGWSSRSEYLTFMGVVVFGLAALFVGLGRAMTSMPELINLPHRDYWLAPERRANSIDFLKRHELWLGAATLLFFAAITELTVHANRLSPPRLPNPAFWIVVAIYGATFVGWLRSLYRRFSSPPL